MYYGWMTTVLGVAATSLAPLGGRAGGWVAEAEKTQVETLADAAALSKTSTVASLQRLARAASYTSYIRHAACSHLHTSMPHAPHLVHVAALAVAAQRVQLVKKHNRTAERLGGLEHLG
eukprot:349912-Chlamydomonas_euryale.AAC.12